MNEVSLIDRLSAFLPELHAANDALERQRAADPESVNIEHINDPDAQHIEMVRPASCCYVTCQLV